MAHVDTQRGSLTASVALALGSAAAGDTVSCKNGEILIVQNTDVAAHTVTIAIPGTDRFGSSNPDKAYPIPAGEIHPIKLDRLMADPADGEAHLSYSATTGMKRTVLR